MPILMSPLFLVLSCQYMFTHADVGYFIGTENSGTLVAGEVCNNAGGRLAIITSDDKFTEASSVASSSGYGWVAIALHCTSRDTTCGSASSKWTWYDSTNDNEDLCDLSTGSMDTLSYYQTWDQWDKTPDEDEYCVEFYGGKFVLEFCSNPDGIYIDSDTSLPYAALCQPLTASISDCSGVEDEYFIGTDNTGSLTAGEVCNNAGGRLAIIESDSKFTEASAVASASGYLWVVVALHCTSRDTTCGSASSKWTWYDSTNDNEDLCDLSTGSMDTLSYYQTWDQWDKTPDEDEYCVEFYGGKFVLEFCSDPDGIYIDSDTELPNAALCQPLSFSISDCSSGSSTSSDSSGSSVESETSSGSIVVVLLLAVVIVLLVCFAIGYMYRKKSNAADESKSSLVVAGKDITSTQHNKPAVPEKTATQAVPPGSAVQKQPTEIIMVQTANGQFVQAQPGYNPQVVTQNFNSFGSPGYSPAAPVVVAKQSAPVAATPSAPVVVIATSAQAGNKQGVRSWMTNVVALPQYVDNLMSNGYDSLQIIKDITDRSELADIGIDLKGHQTRIMKQIEALRNGGSDAGYDNVVRENQGAGNDNMESEGRVTVQ